MRELRGGIATFGTFGTARWYPGTDDRRRVPRAPPERARAARRPELVRGRRGRPRRRRSRPALVALPIDDTRPGRPPDHARRDRLRRRAEPGAAAQADDDRASWRSAPLILTDASYGLRGPDAPPARRAGPARRRRRSSRDRRRGRRDRDRARRARPRRHAVVSRGILLSLGRRAARDARLGRRSPSRSTTRSPSSTAAARRCRRRRASSWPLAEERMQAMADELRDARRRGASARAADATRAGTIRWRCPRTTPPSPRRSTSRRSSGSTRPGCR